jgi:hypothetical protein
MSIESAQTLTVHISPAVGSEETAIILLLWQPATGEWTVIPTMPKDVAIEDPAPYVDNVGNIYISIFTPQGKTIDLNDFWVTLEATATDGSKIILDKSKSS